MSTNKELAQFEMEDGTTVLIEIETVNSPGVQRAALAHGQMVVKAKQTFEQALDKVIPAASVVMNRVRKGLTDPADEVEVKFGLKLTSEVGAVIASAGVEANFDITLKWKAQQMTVHV